MSILDILTFPCRILQTVSRPIVQIDGALQDKIDAMAKTMYEAPGVGLAANQVGLDRRVLVYDIAASEKTGLYTVLINPKIVETSGEILSEDEGCLSVPDFRSNVRRFARVLVDALDRDGNPLRIEADGFHAIVLQHEIDHLDGKLFIDRISSLKRQMYKKRRLKAVGRTS